MKLSDIPVWAQLLIFAGLAGFLVFAAEKWLFDDYKSEIEDLDNKISALDQEIQRAKAVTANYADFERQVKELSSQLEKLKKILPTTQQAQDLMRRLESLASQSDLNVLTFQPGTLIPKDYYFEWPIQLTTTGSYHNLAKFYEKIGNYRRIINIANIRMNRVGAQSKTQTLTANYTAVTYVYKE